MPLTHDSLDDPAQALPAIKHSSELCSRLAGFQRHGTRVVLALGVPPDGTNAARRSVPDLTLTCIAAPDDGWSGMLHAIGELYVAGVSLDWKKFESPWPRQRLALPTYPFQRQDCWLKFKLPGAGRKSLQKELHPLLGRRIHSPRLRDEIVFEAEFDSERLPMLKDHSFFATVVVPAVVMMEMGMAAGRIALGDGDISLNDFVIEQPLLLPEGQTNLVQTVLTPDGANAYSFVILSADIAQLEGAPAWKRHCSGKLAAVPRTTTAPPVEAGILDRLRARYDRSVEPGWFYGIVAQAGAEYGPAFRLMRTLHGGENGSLTFLQIPPEMARESAAYGAHPGLLDAAVQSLGICYLLEREDKARANGGQGEKDVYMPVAIDSYRLSLAGCSEMWCHATRRPWTENKETIVGDLQLYSTTGEVIGEMRGLQFKRNASKDFKQQMAERRLANWLYNVRWEPLPMLAPAEKEVGAWLIVSDGTPVAAELASVVRQRGGRAITGPGPDFSRQSTDTFTIRFGSAGDCDELLRAVIDSGEPLRGVVYFTESRSDKSDAGGTLPELAGSRTEQFLHLTQALARNGGAGPAALALVTEGFQTPNLGIRSSLAGSAAWGLGRVIAAELPDLHCKLIDLEPSLPAGKAAEMLAHELCGESDENQVALGDGKRLALRLTHADPSLFGRENSIVADPRGAVALEIGARGDLQQLRFVPQHLPPPDSMQVQLRILATGLNFRDVLNALGLYPGNAGGLGVECVGEIVALGPDVSGWSVGDQVIAIASPGYCTYVNAYVYGVFRRPPNLSLADAATLPVAYLTAAYTLCHLGGMRAGHRVLIHSAAGGVGLAAVQLAQQAGAEIFATAGSPAKREYLRQLGIPHVMDSRSLDFASQIRESTAGEGVDLVLNSLTGQAVTEGLSLLRPGGHFLEIGKNELLSEERVAAINPGARYHTFDVIPAFQAAHEVMHRLFAVIAGSLATGALRPLPHRTFSLPGGSRRFPLHGRGQAHRQTGRHQRTRAARRAARTHRHVSHHRRSGRTRFGCGAVDGGGGRPAHRAHRP